MRTMMPLKRADMGSASDMAATPKRAATRNEPLTQRKLRWPYAKRPTMGRGLILVVVSVDRFADLFLDERLVRREVVGHHTPDVLDLLVLFVELQLFLEIHLFA